MKWVSGRLFEEAGRLAVEPERCNLASGGGGGHAPAMRFLIPLAALLATGCTLAPQDARPRPAQSAQPIAQSPHVRSDLLGLSANELVERFGTPALQIREGPGIKLQFRGAACILDAYLYPPQGGHGQERVTHVDARLRSGVDTDQATCIAALQGA